jgi:hypothetical protein
VKAGAPHREISRGDRRAQICVLDTIASPFIPRSDIRAILIGSAPTFQPCIGREVGGDLDRPVAADRVTDQMDRGMVPARCGPKNVSTAYRNGGHLVIAGKCSTLTARSEARINPPSTRHAVTDEDNYRYLRRLGVMTVRWMAQR